MWKGRLLLQSIAVKGWNGKAQGWGELGRIATIDLDFDGCWMRVGSVYMPVHIGDGIPQRLQCFKDVQTAGTTDVQDGCVFFGGDWNSHIGRDGVENRYAMVRGSSAGGKQMLKWLQKDVPKQFVVADHRIPAKFRGTWGSQQRGEWYELIFL